MDKTIFRYSCLLKEFDAFDKVMAIVQLHPTVFCHMKSSTYHCQILMDNTKPFFYLFRFPVWEIDFHAVKNISIYTRTSAGIWIVLDKHLRIYANLYETWKGRLDIQLDVFHGLNHTYY